MQVTKVFENNTYKMSDAVITNAQNGADISLSGNTITVTVENKAKYFDLALRKYITQVNGENVANTRVPVIDTTSLTTGTTASYKHRKDPVAVTTGDKVIYNLTIYNEGQKPGRATKLQDQLPTVLVFNRVVSGNFELDSYSETDNLLKLRRTSNTDNLDAYNGTTLDSETIQIECTVTAVPTNKEQNLTNVAWISEEYDAESNVTITNEENADRDSVPGTHPDVNKDNMEDYTGNNNKEDLTDEDYYYKGQEDDDDFEKLKLVYFDLSLRKFITGRNDTTLTNREPQVDVTHLADGTSTTATYNHPKNPIDMQRGDIVIYTIRVYNEGSMDGYANEITDYLPEELKFNSELNKDWYEGKDGVIYNASLANTIINPGESKEVTLILTKNMNGDDDFGLINNSAEIYETSNDYGALDIDSTPGNKATNEDDYSTANVLTSVKTGDVVIYTTLIITIITIVGVGIYMIKKKVLI